MDRKSLTIQTIFDMFCGVYIICLAKSLLILFEIPKQKCISHSYFPFYSVFGFREDIDSQTLIIFLINLNNIVCLKS